MPVIKSLKGRLEVLVWVTAIGPITALAVLAAGCGSSSDTASPESNRTGVRIASFDFAESELVAEVYAQAIEGAGLPVIRLGAVGPREVVAPALEKGLIDVVPEYMGTAARHFAAQRGADDLGIDASLQARGLMLLDPAPAENVNVFVVTPGNAAAFRLSTLSDLGEWPVPMRLGGPAECTTRPYCQIGLEEVYGVRVFEFVPQSSLARTAEALVRHEIDVGVMFSTAAELLIEPLVVLEDDLRLQPDENIVPLVRMDAVERWGPLLTDALHQVSSRLTTGDLQRMNQAVAGGTPIDAVVSSWIDEGDMGR